MTGRIRMEVCPSRSNGPWQVVQRGIDPGVVYRDPFSTQGAAIADARWRIARLVSYGDTVTLKIKRPDGRIREERTYPRSSDPRRSKG